MTSAAGRLCDKTLPQVPQSVRVPGYDRSALVPGIAHLGPGAFHRGHEAVYADDALLNCPALGILAVSLRSSGVRDALAPQDGLYTLAIADTDPDFRVIGSICEILVAPESPGRVCERLSDPSIHTVSLTVTEKGYCLDANGELDVSHADIRADLATPGRPTSAIGFLVEALRRRRDAGSAPFVVVSCDNQSENGTRLGNAVMQFARELDPGLASWIADEVRFPLTMVDSITPASDAAARASVRDALGLDDAWPIRRERFTQWVVETGCLAYEEAWAAAGVTFDDDIRAFEMAKLRLLNGQHSTLAYLGILAGYATVAEAVADADLRQFVDALVAAELKPSVRAPANLDLDEYCRSLLLRFGNPMVEHRVEQIAIDGSQKMPIRILATVRDNLAAGRPTRLLAMAVAGWLNFLETRDDEHAVLDDPIAEELLSVSEALRRDVPGGVRRFLRLKALGADDLDRREGFVAELVAAYRHLNGARGGAVGERIAAYLAAGASV